MKLKKYINSALNWSKALWKWLTGQSLRHRTIGCQTIGEEEVKLAKQCLKQKPEATAITEFENAFCQFNECQNAFSFMGARVALSVAIEALNLQKGDKILLPAFTCVVVPNAFWYAGVEIVFCDIELDTFGLDYEDVLKKYTQDKGVKGIVIQHLFGLVCRDFEQLLKFAKQEKIAVIEDCAHATGARWKGRRVGNFGDVAIYSSEHSKCFNTFNGGLLTTNDGKLAKRIAVLQSMIPFPSFEREQLLLHNFVFNYYTQTHPQRRLLYPFFRLKYAGKLVASTTKEEMQHQKPTHYGQRMPASLAAIGLLQLKKLEQINAKRRQLAQEWDEWCANNGFKKPLIKENSEPVFLRYPVLVSPAMKQDTSWAEPLQVEVGDWFKSYLHPVEYEIADCPNAIIAVAQCINLPTI